MESQARDFYSEGAAHVQDLHRENPKDTPSRKGSSSEKIDRDEGKIVANPIPQSSEKTIHPLYDTETASLPQTYQAPEVISNSSPPIVVSHRNSHADALEVVPTPLNSPPSTELPTTKYGNNDGGSDTEKHPPGDNRKTLICGLPAKHFYILLSIGLGLVIGAVVGGSVGGTMAARQKAEADSPLTTTNDSTITSSSFPPAPTGDAPPLPTIGTQYSLTGFYLLLYSGANFTGAVQNISRIGEFAVDFSVPFINGSDDRVPTRVSSYIFATPTDGVEPAEVSTVGRFAKSYLWNPTDRTGACVRFCEGGESAGYRCSNKVEKNGFLEEPGQFRKVLISIGYPADEQLYCGDT